MTFTEFEALVTSSPDPVVLLEGRRSIPDADAALAERLARSLAAKFPRLRFRSGNAAGSDEAFSRGILAVDPSRLQIVAPYASHRKSFRHPDAAYASPGDLTPEQDSETARMTVAASPRSERLIAARGQTGPLAAKSAYLIRDTMKVTGHSEAFPKPVCALFYADLGDPLAGGTGHTIRVCRLAGVPYALQDSWSHWQTD